MKQIKNITVIVTILLTSVQTFAQDVVIQKNELPKAAQTFIQKYFGEETPSQIIKDTDHLIYTEYKVFLNNGVEIEFDDNGNWEEIKNQANQAIPTNFIAKPILDYVKKSFPNTHIVKIEKDKRGFDVELSNGIDLEFNSKGNFVRIDD